MLDKTALHKNTHKKTVPAIIKIAGTLSRPLDLN